MSNHKQEWLLKSLSEFNHEKEIVQAEIDATTDVLTMRKLEKRLDIIFGKIEDVYSKRLKT